ncbi:MAG TPA: HlyD family secretion protein, partial [Hellea balneolensis]|nr:HlyD family secretion protein [Hellea balneolensis]
GILEETMAAADVDQTNAEISVADAKLKSCNIYAPYAGTVQDKHVSAYDTPALNAPLLSIIRAGTPEIKLIAPSSWLSWMRINTEFHFTIDETQKTYSARIIRKGARVDPVSQTIELTARFLSKTDGALAGMSGVANFNTTKPAQ